MLLVLAPCQAASCLEPCQRCQLLRKLLMLLLHAAQGSLCKIQMLQWPICVSAHV